MSIRAFVFHGAAAQTGRPALVPPVEPALGELGCGDVEDGNAEQGSEGALLRRMARIVEYLVVGCIVA